MAAGAVIKSLFDLLFSVEARWLRLLAARTPCFGLIAAHHRKHPFGQEGIACLRVLLSSHRGGASQNPVHLDFARPGVRSKQREAHRAQ